MNMEGMAGNEGELKEQVEPASKKPKVGDISGPVDKSGSFLGEDYFGRGGKKSRKRIKDLKDAIRRRTIKLHSKVNSSSKGSRKVHKERKPQRTRRLNK